MLFVNFSISKTIFDDVCSKDLAIELAKSAPGIVVLLGCVGLGACGRVSGFGIYLLL
jgi:hypothetical protein